MNVRLESLWPNGPYISDFVVGVDEWDFHRTEFGWHAHLVAHQSECSIGDRQGAEWSPDNRRHPTEEQFNFARSFLSLTQ